MSSTNAADRLERLSRTELIRLQTEQLNALLAEIGSRNRFWSQKFAAAKVVPAEIRTLDDLRRVPLTTKAELLADQQAHPPYGTNLTYEPVEYSRLHQTSGTTGFPLRWLDTPRSWEWCLQCWSQLFRLMGLQREDRLFFPFSFGPFLGFWAGFEGANRLGNLCLPGGGLSSPARLNLMLENRATVVCCTPTYALRLAEIAAEQNIDLAGSPVRALLVAGEPGGNVPATRKRIEQAWGARVIDHWGMTELGPLAIETADRPGGLCVLETECIAEIIDPSTGQPVPAGEEGELVITNLGRWGSPLLRYRTGDRVHAGLGGRSHPQQTECGESALLWLDGGILGRTDDMLTIRGNNFYPAALEDIIRQFADVAEYRIEVRSVKSMQHVRIEIEPAASVAASGEGGRLVQQIAELIKNHWNFQAEVVESPPGTLPRFEMKGRRFFRVGE